MSKTLLAIISTPRDNKLVERHWPYFKMTGWDILGAGSEDGQCAWPEPVMRLDTGVMGTRMTPAGSSIFGLVKQELDIWSYFLRSHYNDLCIVEADNLFVRQPPEHPGNGLYLVTLLPNYSKTGLFNTPIYFSTPRWSDHQCTEQLYRHGKEMLNRGDHEHWISDRFPAHICHRHHIPWMAQPAWSPAAFHWGAKTSDEAWVRDARAAIKIGNYCLHSVKTEAQLESLKDLLPAV